VELRYSLHHEVSKRKSCCLQVVDSPDSECYRQDDTAERKDQDGRIAAIQSSSDAVADLLGISTTRPRALGATETGSLFLEKHSSTFSLIEGWIKQSEHGGSGSDSDGCYRTYSIINVTTILANPFTLPILARLGCLLGLGCSRFSVAKNIQQSLRGPSGRGGIRLKSRSLSSKDEAEKGKEEGFHIDPCTIEVNIAQSTEV
jgi:hypothetical protein